MRSVKSCMKKYHDKIRWCIPGEDESPYYIYTMFIKSTGRVYVGHTIDPIRRIREHVTKREQAVQEDTESLDNIVFFVVEALDTKEEAETFEMLWVSSLNSHIDGYNVAYTITVPTVEEYSRFEASREKFTECIKHEEELVQAFNTRTRAYYEDVFHKLGEMRSKTKTKNNWVIKKPREPRKPREKKPERFDLCELEVFRQCYQEVNDKQQKPELTNTERMNKLRETFSGRGRTSTMTFEEGMEKIRRWRESGPIQRHVEKMYITADGLIRPQVNQITIDNYKSPWGKSNKLT